jgi:hypothetical protein
MTAEQPVVEPDADAARTPASPARRIPLWACALIGIASGVLGLLPWLLSGMRLPLQNLWAASTPPDSMPLVLLPFSQYAITSIVGLLVVGSAAGGIVARALARRLPGGGALTIFLALLLVQVVAVAQTATVVRAGLQVRREATLYLGLLVGVAVVAVIVGVLAFWLVAKAPKGGAVVGLSIGALATGPWLTAGVALSVLPLLSDVVRELLAQTRWLPPVLVGAAIAWGGLRTVGRVAAALFGLALVWIVPALSTGIFNAAGSRVLAHEPLEMLSYGVQVFELALVTPEYVIPPLVVAVVVAGLGIAGTAIIGRIARDDAAAQRT